MATDTTPETFWQAFPAFASVPQSQVAFWIGYADKLLYDVCRWSDMREYGISLVVAHQLTLAARDNSVAAAGGLPGSVQGAVSSKSVGGVSVSYDTSSAVLSDGGYWNLTSFGIQFLQLARLVGSGGFQL
jgi:hypothetical protein